MIARLFGREAHHPPVERNWEELLVPEAKKWLEETRKVLFADEYDVGFRVIASVSQDSGRLLTTGSSELVQYVQEQVANEEIDSLKVHDSLINEYHLYTWGELAIVPKDGWQGKNRLRVKDLSIHPAGVTIFVLQNNQEHPTKATK